MKELYFSTVDKVAWPSGQARVCKTSYDGSNPSTTSPSEAKGMNEKSKGRSFAEVLQLCRNSFHMASNR
jgi:hypothetical protein